MYDPNPFRGLAERVEQGDQAAAGQLHVLMDRALPPIVRLVMRTRQGNSRLARLILEILDQLPYPSRDWPPDEQEAVVREVVHRLRDATINGLRPTPTESVRVLETVRA